MQDNPDKKFVDAMNEIYKELQEATKEFVGSPNDNTTLLRLGQLITQAVINDTSIIDELLDKDQCIHLTTDFTLRDALQLLALSGRLQEKKTYLIYNLDDSCLGEVVYQGINDNSLSFEITFTRSLEYIIIDISLKEE